MGDIQSKEEWFYEFPEILNSDVNDYSIELQCNSLQNAILPSLDKNGIMTVALNPFVYFAPPGSHMCDVTIADEDSGFESVLQVFYFVDCDV